MPDFGRHGFIVARSDRMPSGVPSVSDARYQCGVRKGLQALGEVGYGRVWGSHRDVL